MILGEVRAVDDLSDGLDGALGEAELPALLAAVAHLTGDLGILEPGLRASGAAQVVGQAPQGGLSAEAQERARQLVRVALRRWASAGRPQPEHSDESMLEILRFVAGDVGADQLPLLYHQLGMDQPCAVPVQARTPDGFRVAVIGAGMSGIAASRHLRRAGIDHVVLERHPEVGGVWLENTYPGVRLDTSNFCYSYSFAQRDAWEDYYSPGEAVAAYLKDAADETGIRDGIRFSTTVRSATYDEPAGRWRLELSTPTGEETLWADAIISAVGQLNTPLHPRIPGIDSFAGDSWHTSRWEHDVQLTGKRVAVIGTGASAFQVISQIAPDVKSLTVFQRTPPWVVPTPTYTRKLPPGLRWLFRMVPDYLRWYRLVQFWTNVEGRRRYALVDPAWDKPGSVSADSDRLERAGRPARARLRRPTRPPGQDDAGLPALCQADAARRRNLGSAAATRQRRGRHGSHRGHHRDGRPHVDRRRARGRRHHLRHRLHSLDHLFEHRLTGMEPTREALDAYYARLDEASARTAYGLAGVSSWYKSQSGRVTQNWPLSTLEFWEMTRAPAVEHYRFW